MHKKWDIDGSISEWRDFDRDHVDAVEKVLPKLFLLDALSQVAMCCTYQTDIRRYGIIRTHANDFSLFQHPQ